MKVSRSALLPYSAPKMFDIIADVRSYPDFLNWCRGAELLDESANKIVAKLSISYVKLGFSFTTENKMRLNESVQIRLVDGPFSSLEGLWTVTSLNDSACKVALDMQFAFDNAVTHKLLGGVFQKVIATQLDAFQNRAKQLHGEGNV